MTKKIEFRYIKYVASLFDKFLPDKAPSYDTLSDQDYITILSWCEDWEPNDVYYTAWNASNLDIAWKWEDWAENMKELPGPVRYQLRKGLEIHHKAGNLKTLKTYAFFSGLFEKWTIRVLWVSLFITIYYLYF